jgi:hypothetical protein
LQSTKSSIKEINYRLKVIIASLLSCKFIQFLLRLDPRFYLFDHGVELLLALFVGLGVDVVGFALDRSYTMTAPKDFHRILKQQDGEVTAFSEKLLCGLTDYATVYADGRLTFTFKKRVRLRGLSRENATLPIIGFIAGDREYFSSHETKICQPNCFLGICA